jgi:hypothetical protein
MSRRIQNQIFDSSKMYKQTNKKKKMILSYYRINYLNEFKNVTYSNEVNYFKMIKISLWYIAIFIDNLDINKNYICTIYFISDITNVNSRFDKYISAPFLINQYSSPYLIYKLIESNLRNKHSINSLIQIQYSEIYTVDNK